MGHTTYGFEDLNLVFQHPSVGVLPLQGAGVVSITYTYSTDVTTHDLAADGSVMASKIKAANATIALVVQQTSEANEWLIKYYNYVTGASTAEWTGATCSASSKVMKKQHDATGVSPQKMPDNAYAANGGQVTWTFMAQNLTTNAA